MHDWLRYAITGFLLLLICFCVVRQRRYWREIKNNRPSASVKCGYVLACLSISLALIGALFFNTEESWKIFMSILTMGLLFSLKITFSPSMIGITLAICTFQFYTQGSFPIYEVWTAFVRIVTWRFPEEVRVTYATISFAWACIILFVGSTSGSGSDASEVAMDSLPDPFTTLPS